MTNEKASILDSLLDATLDDLADVPEFKPFPIGVHRCTIKWDMKVVNDSVNPQLTITAIETVDLKDPTNTPCAPGDSTSQMFSLKKKDGTRNELGEGQWKNLLRPLKDHFMTSSIRETMDASNGCEVLAVTSIRTDKRDKDNPKHYTEIVNIQVM